MKNDKDFLRKRRIEIGLTMLDIAKSVGVSEATVSRWESGEIANMKRDKIAALANALRVPPAEIMGWDDNTGFKTEYIKNLFPVKLKKFPLLGEIACGKPIYADEQHGEYIEASVDIKADFCLRAKGDSMIEAQINDGDVVFVHEQPIVENGEIAAVIIDDEATLKRWYYDKEKNKLTLVAANAKYSPLVYIGEELNSIRCLGRAVSFMKYL